MLKSQNSGFSTLSRGIIQIRESEKRESPALYKKSSLMPSEEESDRRVTSHKIIQNLIVLKNKSYYNPFFIITPPII